MDLRVKFCCCCIELRMGVLILGYLGIVGATVNYLESFLNPLLPIIINSLIFVGVLIPSICLVIAIHKNIPDLMLLTLLSCGMGIITLLVAPFVLPSLAPDPDDAYRSPEEREALHAVLDNLFIICWIAVVIDIYFCVVVYSQFSAMKEEEVNRSNTPAAHDMPTINTIA